MLGLNLWQVKRAKTVLHGFIEIVNESKYKLNKLKLDEGREFYNELMQKWLDNDDILIYSSYNKGRSVVAERFIQTLNDQIYKHMTDNNNKYCLGYLSQTGNKNNNTCHRFIGKNPIDVDNSALIEETEMNPKAPKFKVGDRVRITK